MRLVSLLCLVLACAAAPASGDDVALGGRDAVAYRAQGVAVPGDDGFVTRWRGEEWRFASDANRAAFEANPRAYAPGFKGLCPVSIADGKPVAGDPDLFAIIGAQLYLLSSEDARGRLLADPRDILMRAKAAFVGQD